MKLEVRMIVSIPDESGYDSALSVTEVVAHALKQNQVFQVHELNVEESDV